MAVRALGRRLRGTATAVAGALVVTALTLVAPAAGPGPSARADVPTVSVDALRTGWDPAEPALSPSAVASSDFGRLFTTSVDGAVYGQPVVAGGLVLVTTENATTYAFDAVSGALRWSRHFGAPFEAASIGCGDLAPDLGSTSTPVVDLAAGRIYLTTKLADGADVQHPHWYLQALSIADGSVVPGFPVTIAGTPDNTPGLPFDPFYEHQRPGLLLLDGVVYAAFGAHCDVEPYRGYVVGVSTTTHAVTTMWSVESGTGTDVNSGAGIWQSGGGLVSDGSGRIFLTTGNGISPPPGGGDSPPGTLAESVVRLQVGTDGRLRPASFFAPSNAPTMDQYDTDLGSGGPVGLPSTMGTAAHPRLLVQVGKDGRVFLLDRDHLGGRMQGPGGTDAALQVGGPYGGVWGHPAAYGGEGGWVYTVESQGALRALRYGVDGSGSPTLSSAGTSTGVFGYSSGSPVVTSNGTTAGSALVWVQYAINSAGSGGQLRAYRAVPSSGVLQLVWSGSIGTASKFAVPATDGGRVYVGTRDGHLIAFGRPAAPALTTNPLDAGRVAVGASKVLTEKVTASRDVTVSAVAATGAGWTAGRTTPALPVLLHAGQTLSVPVTFAPTTAGDSTGSLTLTSDAGTAVADLHGYGSKRGLLAVPGAVDFGQVAVKAGPRTISVTVSNSGATATTIGTSVVRGAGFSSAQLPVTGTVLAPQQSVTVPVTYAPTTWGASAGTLTVRSSTGTLKVALTGTAVVGSGRLVLSPTSTDVGTVAVGSSRTVTFDVGNAGTIPLTITKAKAPAGAFSSDLPLPEGLTLAPGAVVHQRVTFAPTAAGPVTASYLVTSDDGRGPQTETLTGLGSAPLPAATAWQLNGSAQVVGGSTLRLTDTGAGEAGSAIYGVPVPTDGLTASFTVHIDGGTGADGMTFALLDPAQTSPTSLGGSYSGLGYSGLSGVAVAIDTYTNATDPASPYLGVTTGVQTGDIRWSATGPQDPSLRGTDVPVTVSVKGGVLTAQAGSEPPLTLDVSSVVGPTAYVAFTGATGGATDDHDVVSSQVLPGQ